MTARAIRLVAVGGSGVGIRFTVPNPAAPGETALADDVHIITGGKGANNAIGAAFLGAHVDLVSAVGSDAFGMIVRDLLKHHGVSRAGLIELSGGSTMVGAVMVEAGGENRITLAPGVLARLDPGDIRTHSDLIARADVCLVSLEIAVPAAVEALRIARAAGVLTILNPAPAPARPALGELLALADWVTPNEGEAAALGGSPGPPEEHARRLLELGARGVVITLGPLGALIADGAGTRRVAAPAVPPAEMVDTSGAGDAFNMAFALALAAGLGVDAAAILGCEAGSRICRGPGFVEALDTLRGLAVPTRVATRG